jgi:hypothetical protein
MSTPQEGTGIEDEPVSRPAEEVVVVEAVSDADWYASHEFDALLLRHFQTARNNALATHASSGDDDVKPLTRHDLRS